MNQTYTRSLLQSIAAKLGRNKSQLEPFINALQSQWYSTKQSLAALTSNDYQRMKIPGGLAAMIKQAVSFRQKNNESMKMEIQSPIQEYLAIMSHKNPPHIFAKRIQTLNKIFTNIRQNLIDEKFRILKKSNSNINELTSIKEVVKILQYGGFQEVHPGYVMKKVKIGTIDQCLDALSKFVPKAQFNPYQSHISSIGQTTVENYQGQSSVVFNQMLAQLQRTREKIMSKNVARNIKVFQLQPQFKIQYEQQFNEQKQSTNQEQKLYIQNVKKLIEKQTQNAVFVNRRKQQYEDLAKKPIYSETIIRVKLHENWIFECTFAPLQTLQSLVNIFHECLKYNNLNYYLYMTPPVQILSGQLLTKTFYELGCVPRAIFHFKCEQNLSGYIFKSGF